MIVLTTTWIIVGAWGVYPVIPTTPQKDTYDHWVNMPRRRKKNLRYL